MGPLMALYAMPSPMIRRAHRSPCSDVLSNKRQGKRKHLRFSFGTFTRFHFRILQIYQPVVKTKRYTIFRLRSRINGCEIRTSLNWPEIFCCFFWFFYVLFCALKIFAEFLHHVHSHTFYTHPNIVQHKHNSKSCSFTSSCFS